MTRKETKKIFRFFRILSSILSMDGTVEEAAFHIPLDYREGDGYTHLGNRVDWITAELSCAQ